MGAHKREISDTRMPLRQGEQQPAYEDDDDDDGRNPAAHHNRPQHIQIEQTVHQNQQQETLNHHHRSNNHQNRMRTDNATGSPRRNVALPSIGQNQQQRTPVRSVAAVSIPIESPQISQKSASVANCNGGDVVVQIHQNSSTIVATYGASGSNSSSAHSSPSELNNSSYWATPNGGGKKFAGGGGGTPTVRNRAANRSWRMELVKTVVAFFCLLVSAFLNFFLLTIIHDIVPDTPLPDLVFMIVRQQSWAWPVGDVLSTINALLGFFFILLHRDRVVILRRVFLLAAILYGLRAVVLGVTYLPPSFEHRDRICQPRLNGTSMYATEIATRFVTYVVTLGLTSGQPQILCGDLMFSGHTVVLTIMYFTQLRYTPRGLWLVRWAVTPITFLGIAALVVSGGHYTMDVLIAYWLTSHVFWSYHQVFELPYEQRANAPLSRLWWFWLCWWFEAEVSDGPIRNLWNWPFARPVFLHSLINTLNAKLQ